MNDPLRVRSSGPLAAHADGFREELAARGYTPGSAALQLQLAVQPFRPWVPVGIGRRATELWGSPKPLTGPAGPARGTQVSPTSGS
jgi:hypothetical protein